MNTTETPLDDQSTGFGVRHLVELLLVAALVDQSAKHTLLVLEKVGRRTELGLGSASVIKIKKDAYISSQCDQRRAPTKMGVFC